MSHSIEPINCSHPRRYIVLLVFALAVASRHDAAAANYNFAKIADSAQFQNLGQMVSLNNHGAVAFTAIPVAGGHGVFTGGGGPITTIIDDSEAFDNFNWASINDSGMVAFYATFDGPREGAFTSNGGTVTKVADTVSDFPAMGLPRFIRFPVINSSGTVAFRVLYQEFDPTRLNFSIHSGNGGPLTLIADSSGPLSSIGAVPLRMNDHGAVAFSAVLDGSPGVGIFVGNGGPLTTIVTQAAGFSGFGQPSINNDGALAFLSQRAGINGIFTIDGGPALTVADSTGPFANFGREALINDSGKVAFRATLDAGGQGIFTGPDPASDSVIQTGDSLFGSTVTVVGHLNTSVDGTFDINDNGDVAFRYELANGTFGIAVASVVPEPASMALIFAQVLATLSCRRSQGKARHVQHTSR